jgi:FtsH-binding integral membrane protein
MRSGVLLWTGFLVFGILLWLSTVGLWSHPVYRLILMFAFFACCAWVVRAPEGKLNSPRR